MQVHERMQLCRGAPAARRRRVLRPSSVAGRWAPPADCAGADGACTATLGADADESVADALDMESTAVHARRHGVRSVAGARRQIVRRGLPRVASSCACAARIACSHMHPQTGVRCRVTSLQAHDGAVPLQRGADRCAAHGGIADGTAQISRADLVAGQVGASVWSCAMSASAARGSSPTTACSRLLSMDSECARVPCKSYAAYLGLRGPLRKRQPHMNK